MNELVTTKEIISQIFIMRGVKVMLDFHLAELYEVETRVLKQQVKRNIDRFPDDFVFELTQHEIENLVSQNVIPSKSKFGGALPFAFTEQGVAMLSGILRSEKAVKINIAIMRAFVKMRELIDENKELKKRLDKMEGKYDKQFQIVFEALKQIIEKKNKPRKSIGYKIGRGKS